MCSSDLRDSALAPAPFAHASALPCAEAAEVLKSFPTISGLKAALVAEAKAESLDRILWERAMRAIPTLYRLQVVILNR